MWHAYLQAQELYKQQQQQAAKEREEAAKAAQAAAQQRLAAVAQQRLAAAAAARNTTPAPPAAAAGGAASQAAATHSEAAGQQPMGAPSGRQASGAVSSGACTGSEQAAAGGSGPNEPQPLDVEGPYPRSSNAEGGVKKGVIKAYNTLIKHVGACWLILHLGDAGAVVSQQFLVATPGVHVFIHPVLVCSHAGEPDPS
jgi:multidrug efflux pump subunit AcrA (membrane-fusion protein)